MNPEEYDYTLFGVSNAMSCLYVPGGYNGMTSKFRVRYRALGTGTADGSRKQTFIKAITVSTYAQYKRYLDA